MHDPRLSFPPVPASTLSPNEICAPENEVIVLSPVIHAVKSARFPGNRCLHNQEVADIIIGAEQIQIEIRLEMWLEMFFPAPPVIPDLVLVGVEKKRLLSSSPAGRDDCLPGMIQCVGLDSVIMVHETDIFPPRREKSGICVLRNSLVFSESEYAHPPVLFLQRTQRR